MRTTHPLAGKTVTLNDVTRDPSGEVVPGATFRVEDYWQNVTGKSWTISEGNPAALKYALRTGLSGGHVPLDDVVYGKIGGFGHLVHVSELGDEVSS